MPTHRHLSKTHQATLVEIFRNPNLPPPRIEWADALHLIEAVGTVNDKGHGVYQFVVNDVHHEFKRPHHDHFTNPAEIDELREFLTRARMTP